MPGVAAAGIAGGSLLTVAMVVTVAGFAVAGAGANWRLAEGSGDRAVDRAGPACTETVLTAVGVIGAVEPSAGAAVLTSALRGSCAGAGGDAGNLVSAMAVPSATGGAVRLVAAMLMLLSIRLRARASRALAVRPPNTTATM